MLFLDQKISFTYSIFHLKTFPIEFRKQIEALLGDEAEAFFKSLAEPTPVSFLANKHKYSKSHVGPSKPVPWCPHGYYLDERPQFIFDPAFHAGSYYVMESSSMMLWQVLDTLFDSRDNLRILDLCGAPGGKAMVTANFLERNSLLVVNEVNRSRFQILKENVSKWGMPNIYASNYDPSRIPLDAYFDCVIVDAPCSGEGLFRKTPEAIDAWSRANVSHCSKRQKRILSEAARMVRPGGYLIYSTCTYNMDENIYNSRYLSDNLAFKSKRLNLKFNVSEQILDECYGYQCFPHLVKGEGFFISAFQNKGSATSHSGRRYKNKSRVHDRASKVEFAKWTPYLKQPENFSLFVNEAETFYALP